MKFIPIFLVLFVSSYSSAQSSLEGFATGRYEVRSAKKSPRHPASPDKSSSLITDSEGVNVRTLTPAELAVEKKKEEEKKQLENAAKAAVTPAPVGSPAPVNTPVSAVAKPVENSANVEAEEPDLTTQAKSLFSSKTGQILDFYKEQVHPDDIRNNRVELEFMPTLVYNDSQSNYSFRDYQSYFNALKLKANIWFTPLIGVSGQVLFSFGADMASNDGSASNVPTKYDFMDLGINFRKFFGISRKANSMEFSLLISEDKTDTSSDSTSRIKIKSQGLGLGVKARLPTSANYAWTLGGQFYPRLQHTESETAINVISGDAKESTRLGIEVGGEIKFSREGQMIWNLGLSSERNSFDGAANTVDPSTGLTPSNVSVTNSLYMFSLGYRWGH